MPDTPHRCHACPLCREAIAAAAVAAERERCARRALAVATDLEMALDQPFSVKPYLAQGARMVAAAIRNPPPEDPPRA